MKIVIMQSTYLPWIGYFSLIDLADTFIFLDDVQFEKQSWQQRNKIRTSKGLEWITVPVLRKGRFGQLIKDVEIIATGFVSKHLKQVKINYSKARYFSLYEQEFTDVLNTAAKSGKLGVLNETLIKWISKKLSISTNFINSSDINVPGKRSELLANLLHKSKADTYISPLGSLGYLKTDLDFFKDISIVFHNYDHPVYSQVYRPFQPFASILDLLFNEGQNSLDIIRSGQLESIPIEELA